MNNSSIKFLLGITIIYLIIPNLLFFYFWFFSPLNFALVIGLFILLCFYLKNIKEFPFPVFAFSKKETIFLVLGGMLWTLLIGVGGMVYQMPDFTGHQSKVLNLYNSSWPLIYEYNNLEVIYYFGYYLTPAFLMKLYGQYSHWINYFWVSFGYSLAFFWIFLIFKKSWKRLFVFMLLGSGSVLVNTYFFRSFVQFPQEIWPIFVSSLFEQSSWAPNQVLPSVLVSSIFIYLLFEELNLKLVVFPFVLICIWCVFPVIALAFIIISATLIYRKFDDLLSLALEIFIKYIWILIPVFFYFQSSNGGNVTEFLFGNGFYMKRLLMFFCQLIPELTLIAFFGIFFIKKQKDRNLGTVILIFLIIFAMFRIGVFNDFVARTFVVFYFFSFYLIVKNIHVSKKNSFIVPFLIFDMAMSILLISQKTFYSKFNYSEKYPIYEWDKYKTIYEMFQGTANEDEIKQYSSKKNSIYIKYLANRPMAK